MRSHLDDTLYLEVSLKMVPSCYSDSCSLFAIQSHQQIYHV